MMISNTSFSYRNPLKDVFSEEFFAGIPEVPGVYFMRDGRRRVLYVGKAKCLRTRLATYRNAKPGQVGENVVELLERVRSIDWETAESEKRAKDRENELIHALVPPYNIADCWEEDYLYVGLREDSPERWEFALTGRESEARSASHEIFGCYRHRGKVKRGYLALLRLIHAASSEKPRFSFPAKLTRVSPPYRYSAKVRLGDGASERLRDLLTGRDESFLHLVTERLLENETIPAFVRPGLQQDLETVREFFAACATPNRPGLAVVSHAELRRSIRESAAG
jgi:excinuclease ABC subunit C